jgi:hypothetical protein
MFFSASRSSYLRPAVNACDTIDDGSNRGRKLWAERKLADSLMVDVSRSNNIGQNLVFFVKDIQYTPLVAVLLSSRNLVLIIVCSSPAMTS